MSRYSPEFKESVVRKMMPPENMPIMRLAEEIGVSHVTLARWRNEARGEGKAVPGNGERPERWSAEDKFLIVLETHALNGAELGEYCRSKGIFPAEIDQWREACLVANRSDARKNSRTFTGRAQRIGAFSWISSVFLIYFRRSGPLRNGVPGMVSGLSYRSGCFIEQAALRGLCRSSSPEDLIYQSVAERLSVYSKKRCATMSGWRLHGEGRNPFHACNEAILPASHRYFNLRVTGARCIDCIAPVEFDCFTQGDAQRFCQFIASCLLAVDTRNFFNPAYPPATFLLNNGSIFCIHEFRPFIPHHSYWAANRVPGRIE